MVFQIKLTAQEEVALELRASQVVLAVFYAYCFCSLVSSVDNCANCFVGFREFLLI